MKTPMTLAAFIAWRDMVAGGMPWDCAYRRMADWAGMLEARMAELDPNYQARPWGLNFEGIGLPDEDDRMERIGAFIRRHLPSYAAQSAALDAARKEKS